MLENVDDSVPFSLLSEVQDVLLASTELPGQSDSDETPPMNYYDSLTDEEVAESNAWGEFAESQMPQLKTK